MTAAASLLVLQRAALALAATAVAADDGSARSIGASVTQIQDTLGDLLRSIEESGRENELLLAKRQRLCYATLQPFEQELQEENKTITRLHADIKENEAAAEESEGSSQQVRLDISLVQHTIGQTQGLLEERRRELAAEGRAHGTDAEADERLMQSLLENKQDYLLSLQGQLESVLPNVARTLARAADMKRILADRVDSVAASHAFLLELRRGCSHVSQRAELQSGRGVREATNIDAAMQALASLAITPAPRQRSIDPLIEDLPASLLQLDSRQQQSGGDAAGEAVAAGDELLEIFGGGGIDEPVTPLVEEAASMDEENNAPSKAGEREDKVVDRALEKDEDAVVPPPPPLGQRSSEEESQHPAQQPAMNQQLADSVHPAVASLLEQLKNNSMKGAGAAQHREWCAQVRKRGEVELRRAEDASAQAEAEIADHEEAELQLAASIGRLRSRFVVLSAIHKEVSEDGPKEQALLAKNKKNQQLASKILAQVLVVIGKDEKLAGAPRPILVKAAKALSTAQAALEDGVRSAGRLEHEVKTDLIGMFARVADAAHATKRENKNAELARNFHALKRARGNDTKSAHDRETAVATAFLQKLDEECKPAASEAFSIGAEEEGVEIRALEDAQEVLEGKRPGARGGSSGPGDAGDETAGGDPPHLRGRSNPATRNLQNLSPMERAAAEMGVAVDSDDGAAAD